jgi:hypothetical protein
MHHLWAADLFTVPTLAFKTLHVLVFIAHARRELVHINVTVNPTAAWVWRQPRALHSAWNSSRHSVFVTAHSVGVQVSADARDV